MKHDVQFLVLPHIAKHALQRITNASQVTLIPTFASCEAVKIPVAPPTDLV